MKKQTSVWGNMCLREDCDPEPTKNSQYSVVRKPNYKVGIHRNRHRDPGHLRGEHPQGKIPPVVRPCGHAEESSKETAPPATLLPGRMAMGQNMVSTRCLRDAEPRGPSQVAAGNAERRGCVGRGLWFLPKPAVRSVYGPVATRLGIYPRI